MKALLLAAALLAVAPEHAHAWCRMTTSTARAPAGGACVTDGIPLFWAHRCTVAYRLEQSGTPDMSWDDLRAVAQASFGAWYDVTCPDGSTPHMEAHEGLDAMGLPQLSECNRTEYNANSPNVSTIVFVPGAWSDPHRNDPPNDPAAYAVTTVWHSVRTGEIYDVDMELNDERFTFTRCGDAPCSHDEQHIDLQNVMTHEAGHWFGMAHSGDATATMYFQADFGEISKRTLEPDDVEGFCAAYGTMDPTSSCDDTPRGGLKLTCGTVACGPDTDSLPLSSAGTGVLGAGAPVICHGGANCDVALPARSEERLSVLALALVAALIRARRRRTGR